MNRTSATVIADSIAFDRRLTTLEVTMHPRAVEHFLTHRTFSRNGASRRAIPLWRQIEMVQEDDCLPAKFGAEQPGMQSGDEISLEKQVEAGRIWRDAKRQAVVAAKRLGDLGVHKEVASAPLHPYMWRTYLVSATEWSGFMAQRLSPSAQADIRLVAQQIDQALNNSTPMLIDRGGWHLPYVTEQDGEDIDRLQALSVARCARVSYLQHDGQRDADKDLALFDRLREGGHWSPFEHVARAEPDDDPRWVALANFRGWEQLRGILGA
jgi:thymidylate synthase ThyX